MSHIVLKDINIDKMFIKDTSSSYKLYYKDDFPIKGIPFHCKGKLIDKNNHYKFYILDNKADYIYIINNYLKSSLKYYNGFINEDDNGNYLYFSKNYYTNDKIESGKESLHLNVKYINKNNYNTVIHII